MFEPFAPLFELSRNLGYLGETLPSFVPAADVVMTDENVTVIMDVPGLKVDDIDIELREDVLTVRGERSVAGHGEQEQNGRVWQRLERGHGKVERTLRLPRGLDPDAIAASLTDGVLTLLIPKPESRKPRRIQIASNADARAVEGTATEHRELAGSTT
jgi:HSP20 family protein